VSVTAACDFTATAAATGKRFGVFRVVLVKSSGFCVDESDLSVSSASTFTGTGICENSGKFISRVKEILTDYFHLLHGKNLFDVLKLILYLN